jgi:hypothetical protein
MPQIHKYLMEFTNSQIGIVWYVAIAVSEISSLNVVGLYLSNELYDKVASNEAFIPRGMWPQGIDFFFLAKEFILST